jgi:acetyl esterase/lipase
MNQRKLLLAAVLVSAAALGGAERPVIDLWPEGVPGLKADASADKLIDNRVSNVHRPTLTFYAAPADKAVGTAVVICPGGAYMRLAIDHEGTMVAEWLNSLGVSAFILRYRMQEYGHPAPLQDVLRAVRTVRSRAAEFGVRPDRIGVIGFSAGGHLTSCAGTLFNDPAGRTGAALDAISARPDFFAPIYPVITMKGESVHAGSRKALLGATPAPELIEKMSTQQQVTKETPPCFLVHAQDDKGVPVENTLMFYDALRKAGVPAEVHLYEKGGHGFGMKPGLGQASTWTKRFEEWIRSHGWLTRP